MPRITFDSLRLYRAVLEVRYLKGYLYWDVCGKSIADINTQSNGKIDFRELSGDECLLKFVEKPRIEASFGARRMTLSGTKLRNTHYLRENANLLFDCIKENLKVQDVSRVGYRVFYVLPNDSRAEGEQFVSQLDLFTANIDRFKGFGASLSVVQPIFVLNGNEGAVRISVSAVKRKDADEVGVEFDEFQPRYAVLVDMDFYKENVNADDLDLEKFMHAAEKKVKENIGELLNK